MTSKVESQNCESLTCAAFEDRIHQILDDRLTLTGDTLLMDHAAVCSQCEIKLVEYDSFDDSISFLKQNFAEVTCIVDDDGSNRSLSRPLIGLAGLAAALLIFLNIFGGATTDHPSGFARLVEIEEASQPKLSSTMSRMVIAQPVATPKLKFASKRNRVTPDTSPFSPNFRVADNLPRLPSASDFEKSVSLPFEMLQPVLNYSSEIPGGIAIHCTLNVTIELLRRSLTCAPKSAPETKLGLG